MLRRAAPIASWQEPQVLSGSGGIGGGGSCGASGVASAPSRAWRSA
jgi:hypothetical protein